MRELAHIKMKTPIEYKLPPFTVEHVVSTLSQVTGWGVSQLRIPETWEFTRGAGITCLVIDTGYSDHTDLQGGANKDLSKSFISGTDIIDHNGHSSHCLGIIGARDNASGMVGVAPECTLITAKVLDGNGIGGLHAIVSALDYAIELKPDVISMSLGAPMYNRQIHERVKTLTEMNIPVICAAGNSASAPVLFPANYPETIAVTAFDEQGRPASFNSTGELVDFSAPGVNIYSTYLNQQYAKLSGTSMATPFIAGVVCLLLAKHHLHEDATGLNDCITVAEIKEHLIKYADDKGAVGRDENWGYGVIDPYKLIVEHNGEDEALEEEIV